MKHMRAYAVVAAVLSIAATDENCSGTPGGTPTAASGVQRTTARVQIGSDGLTVEQRNVRDRLVADNQPGSIKHLYVISAYSGQVLIYSTVRGKVTSSGKRLNPRSVAAIAGQYNNQGDFIPVSINGQNYRTPEVLEDDGTYGDSVPYVFWFDAKGIYHQHYIDGGQILHVSDQPLAVKSVVLNMELTQ